jgi:hypothetical protein
VVFAITVEGEREREGGRGERFRGGDASWGSSRIALRDELSIDGFRDAHRTVLDIALRIPHVSRANALYANLSNLNSFFSFWSFLNA